MVQFKSALLQELCRQTIVFRPQEISMRKLTRQVAWELQIRQLPTKLLTAVQKTVALT